MADLSGVSLNPDVPESGSFTVVPEGNYKAVIAGDKIYPTKDGKGRILELTVQIVEGPHAGTTIVDRLNIINASQQAQNIAQGTLKRICNILSIPFPVQNTSVLFGKPLMVKVVVEKFESNKEVGKMLDSNKIKNYGPVVAAGSLAAQKPNVTSW